MDVLFLILNYNTYNETISLTKELLSYDTKLNIGVLIVDNCSPNESFIKIKNTFKEESKVDVILSPENGGYAKGNNFGLKYAAKLNTKYVCVINNDVHFTMATIEKLCELYGQLPHVGFIAPKQMLPGGRESSFRTLEIPTLLNDIELYNPFCKKRHIYTENCSIKNVQEVGIIPGAFVFSSYDVFNSLGFYDEWTFLYCEERFLAKKAKDAGLRSYIVLSESYLHDHSGTISKETTVRKQRRLIYEGRKLYHLQYAKYPIIAKVCIKMCYYLNEIYFFVKMGKKSRK